MPEHPIPARPTVLVTGSAGFFGGVLVPQLIDAGYHVVGVDREPHWYQLSGFTPVHVDIRDAQAMGRLFTRYRFAGVVHAAAVLAHGKVDRHDLWSSNVTGTEVVGRACKEEGVGRLVFISSNCLWAANPGRAVTELDEPNPVEIYGKSKWEGEKVLGRVSAGVDLDVVTIRTPTIIEEGRLGLLAILFEFIDEGRKVWTVGGGRNRYQFVYARDLAEACIAGLKYGRGVYNVGSDDVPTIAEAYEYVVRRAGTASSVAALPKVPTLAAMRLASALGLSPLGPYHYRMIAEDFVFDTAKIKAELSWKPTLTNGEMLWRAYRYYHEHRAEIAGRADVSAHRQPADMGPAIRLLKWLS
jgi:nucleoside-diphosphate-sugar epimerase